MTGVPAKFYKNWILRASIGLSMMFFALFFVWRRHTYSIDLSPNQDETFLSFWAVKQRAQSPNDQGVTTPQASPLEILESRRSHVRGKCNDLDLASPESDTRGRFLVLQNRNLSYCYVPKAGCTYWKRVFIAMQNKSGNRKFSNVSKVQAHLIGIDSLFGFNSFDATYDFLSRSKRMLFVRDPYTRLYSAYQDKFFLNDFWGSFGKVIIKRYRRNPSELALQCGHNVTFEEFLNYALDAVKHGFRGGGEEHWLPISTLCHPCTFDYHFIGKQETFVSDRDYIFKEFDIDIPTNHTYSITLDAMKETIDMAWGRGGNCINITDMLGRMWTMYQSQGHIHSSVAFPQNAISNNITKDDFLNLALAAHKSKTLTPSERHRQREEAVIIAYSSISFEILKKIQELFFLDFELFQYPLKPDYIFDSRLKNNLR